MNWELLVAHFTDEEAEISKSNRAWARIGSECECKPGLLVLLQEWLAHGGVCQSLQEATWSPCLVDMLRQVATRPHLGLKREEAWTTRRTEPADSNFLTL